MVKEERDPQIENDFFTHRNCAPNPPPSQRQEVDPEPAYTRLRARVENAEHRQLPLGKLQTLSQEFLV